MRMCAARIRAEEARRRVFDEAIYVLHTFEKKTQRTPQHDIELARARLRGLAEERRRVRR